MVMTLFTLLAAEGGRGTMSTLKVSEEFKLPMRLLSHRTVVFGGSGAGKTTYGRVLFEEATAAGVLCGAVDLKADWWGLKSTADGQGDGIPVVIFGGEHQDVPLDEAGGASLAEIIVELRQPFIVDLENLSKGKQMRFLAAFFERLYDKNREPLVLFCDEADRYAPQKPMSPEANFCLGAVEDIAKRGRKHGIFPTFIVQRNASLNKNVSELCDVAVVFRTPGPRDQEAVEDWFATKATREQRDDVMTALASLPTGSATMCSAHPEMRLFRTVPFRRAWTFDSSATPEIGKRRIEPKRLAKPDLDEITKRMAATIEKAKAEDPRELQRQIRELKAQLVAKPPTTTPATKERHVEIKVPVLTANLVQRFEVASKRALRAEELHAKASEHAAGAQWRVLAALEGIEARLEAVRRPATAKVNEASLLTSEPIHARSLSYPGAAAPAVPPRPTSGHGAGGPPADGLDGPQQRILDTIRVLMVRGISLSREAVARWQDLHPNGGRYNRGLAALRAAGYIEGLTLTALGQQAAHAKDTGTDAALAALPDETKRRILSEILKASQPLSREDLAARLGLHPNGGRFNRDLAWLRTMGVIPELGPITTTEGLFR
jgi:hypothetical protein